MVLKNKLLVTILLGIFLISLTSATTDYLGTFKQDSEVNLIQTCSNCSFNLISSIVLPNSTITSINSYMSQDGSFFYYNFSGTSLLGNYLVNGIGNPNLVNTTWNYKFDVTYTGNELSQSSSSLYIIMFFFIIFIFVITLIGINNLPSKNDTDPEGVIIKISYLKHFRSILYFVLWLLIVAMLFILSNLGFAYLEDTLIANFFFVLYRISMGLTLPIIVIWFIYIFAQIMDDKKIRQMWERGMFPGGKL